MRLGSVLNIFPPLYLGVVSAQELNHHQWSLGIPSFWGRGAARCGTIESVCVKIR